MPRAAKIQFKHEAQPRDVRFDINSLDDVEVYVNGEVRDFFKDGTIGLKVRATRALLWGGLKHADRLLTPAAVGDLMQKHLDAGGSMNEIYNVLLEALSYSGVIRQGDEAPAESSEGNVETPAPAA